jgi:NAD(P)-dependent dehydrogenase (short-subunit alcohol dehydrogenase family)
MLDFTGKRVVMCGCNSGIGAEVTRLLLEHGAEVVGLDIAPTALAVAEFIEVDLGREASIEAAIERVEGPLDAVIVTVAIPHIVNEGIIHLMVNFAGVRRWSGLVPKVRRSGAIATHRRVAPGYTSTCGLLDLVQNYQARRRARLRGTLDLVASGASSKVHQRLRDVARTVLP